ncbi:DUF2141 domain-containing protein [Thiopseudomonas acetoxidans]|uniref:DUF2141 domain-containing protein n=1 Tax=Thiopseudomonas acetoxidans TaxID=3041622 RepID=A0ABT7SLD5_9GAMM|nr:DUF2141 domain-containing protein [Thiopseudomonas sp. CY1220]MDM7857002.1 DUF2141 domain-containing protein [Thiopseudomonas sp. CY1220]
MNKTCPPRGKAKKTLLIISQAWLLWISFPSFAATLVIELSEQQPRAVIHAALYDQSSTNWEAQPLRAVETTKETIVFTGLPPGRYAVQLFQDMNANGRLDSSRNGIPKEPVGFSNNPSLFRGKPSIDKCWINVAEPLVTENIRFFVRKRYANTAE